MVSLLTWGHLGERQFVKKITEHHEESNLPLHFSAWWGALVL